MDLEIVGRHALLFDDDATAEVVNSGGSLVPWAAVGAADLLLDRHDVRHLLDRVPPRPRRAYSVALLSAPSPDGIPETELDRERYSDLPAGDGEYEGSGDAAPSGNGTDTGHADYNAVPFLYGYPAGSDEPNSSDLCYRPSFYVPESLLNKLMVGAEMRQPPSKKVHQIIARTALFVSEHGGQSEIVLRVKQGDNPTFGFLMPDHHLHSYFRYLVDHPQLLKDGADAVGTNKGNTESEHASSGGALSLLGTAYDSGDEDEATLPRSLKGMNPGNSMTPDVQDHVKPASILPDKKELGKDQNAAAPAVKSTTILTKKNPILTGNSIVAVPREKVNDTITASTASKSHTSSGLSETKEMILEPPSFMKRTMEKIIEFILTNGKEFEEKLIEQDRTTGRFPFLLSSNPYHSYYLKFLKETEESRSHGRSPNHKDRRGSSDRRGRRSPESDDRSSHERADRISRERVDRSSRERMDRSSREHADSSRERGDRRYSMERKDSSYGMVSRASGRSSAGPSEKQLYDNDKQGKGTFHPVCGAKKEPTRKVTADEAAAIVMAATRGLGAANDSLNTMKGTNDNVRNHVGNDPSSSFGSLSSLQDRDALSKRISNSEADASLTSSGQPQREGFGIIDDDWIANTIAKAAAAAASKEADSSEASMTKEQKLKAERLRRAKMFAAIIKSGDNKMNDLAAASDTPSEAAKVIPDMNVSGLDLQSVAKEREGSSAPFEHEGPNLTKHNKDSDDEQNRVRKYRKKHQDSDEEKDESEDSYKHSRKRHRPEHSRGRSKDVHKHKHKSHSKDRESRHRRHRYDSSEDEQEHERRSSKSRHRHRDDYHYSDEEEHRRSHKHRRREHHSSSKRKHEEDRDQSEQSPGRLEVSPSRSGGKFESDKLPDDTAQSTQGTTEVPSELRAKIRAMLLERL